MDLDTIYQKSGRGRNGSLVVTTTTDDTTLITASTSAHTIYVQRLIIMVKTDAAQSITFQDSAASPFYVCKVTTSPGADTRWDFYFGPRGMPLGIGKNLVMNVSAIGLAVNVLWNCYQTPTLIS